MSQDRPAAAGQRPGDTPADRTPPAPLPAHVIEALTADIRAAARRVLSDEERASVVVSIEHDERGHYLRVSAEDELVDRLERALFPDRQADGQARTTSARQDRGEAAPDPAV